MDTNDRIACGKTGMLRDMYTVCQRKVEIPINSQHEPQADPIELYEKIIPTNKKILGISAVTRQYDGVAYRTFTDQHLTVFLDTQHDDNARDTVQNLINAKFIGGLWRIVDLLEGPLVIGYSRNMHNAVRSNASIEPSIDIDVPVYTHYRNYEMDDIIGADTLYEPPTIMKYTLCGVVCHRGGGILGGHYVYWQRFGDGWRQFNDDRVLGPYPGLVVSEEDDPRGNERGIYSVPTTSVMFMYVKG